MQMQAGIHASLQFANVQVRAYNWFDSSLVYVCVAATAHPVVWSTER